MLLRSMHPAPNRVFSVFPRYSPREYGENREAAPRSARAGLRIGPKVSIEIDTGSSIRPPRRSRRRRSPRTSSSNWTSIRSGARSPAARRRRPSPDPPVAEWRLVEADPFSLLPPTRTWTSSTIRSTCSSTCSRSDPNRPRRAVGSWEPIQPTIIPSPRSFTTRSDLLDGMIHPSPTPSSTCSTRNRALPP